ncbi:MAG TPA: hypothetical protein PLZ77_04745 [Lachnospiraceae bacterium]|nr:hypothetical protein [Lachnospiraceae bacterium]
MNKKNNPLFYNFIRLGTLGCLIEIIFTALGNLRHRKYHLSGTTSLWMFPIYGTACLIGPLYQCIRRYHWFTRGFIYASLITIAELISGRILQRIHCCPWNYEHSKWNIGRVIRLDYLPCWFMIGLLFEQCIKHNHMAQRNEIESPCNDSEE